jgi:hypothetical protein
MNMKSRGRIIFVIVTAMLLLPCCTAVFFHEDPPNNPINNFENLWQDVKERYSYFELKKIDWDSVYTVYRPLVSQSMDDKMLFKVLGDMLYELKDGHVNLTSNFNRSRNWNWYLDYEANFNWINIERNYLKKNHFITGPIKNQLIGSVLYIYCGSFSEKLSLAHANELMERASAAKGVIVDVRNNGGGSLSNARLLASCFTDGKVLFARERVKMGPADNEFSEWIDMVLKPKDGKRYSGRVVVICNRTSYSATTFFAQMMRRLPHVTLIGDQTGGGGGVPASGEMPNGWRYRLSITQTITPEGEHIELGVPVDMVVSLKTNDEHNGKDTLIEKALSLLLSP